MTLKKIPSTGGAAVSLTSTEVDDLLASLSLPPVDAKSPAVIVTTTDDQAALESKIETLLAEETTGAPWGVGRTVKLPTGMRTTGTVALSQNQSLVGAGQGATALQFDATGLAAGTYAHIDVADDSLNKRGMRGQARIQDMVFDGNGAHAGGTIAVDRVVTGYRCSQRPDGLGGFKPSRAHHMDNVCFHNYTGNGVEILDGNDQFTSFRARAENCALDGFRIIGSSDQKHIAMGSQGSLRRGLYAEHCGTLVIKSFDFGNPNSGFIGEYTVEFVDMQRLVFEAGTISGRLAFRGKNDNGTGVRYDATSNMVRDLSIKVDEYLADMYTANGGLYTYDHHILCEDIDELIFDSLKVMWNDTSPTQTQIDKRPSYIFKHSTTVGGATAAKNRPGRLLLLNASGLVHKYARTDDGVGLMACSKHWSDQPRLVDFANFVPGRYEPIPNWMIDGADPEVRSHVAMGATIIKDKDPFGYLCATLNQATPGTLDDVETQVTLPTAAAIGLPDLGSTHSWGMRIMPC